MTLKYLLDPERTMITINGHEIMLSKTFVDTFFMTKDMMVPELFGGLHTYTLDSYKDGLDPCDIFVILLNQDSYVDYDKNDMPTMQMVFEFYHVHMIDPNNRFSWILDEYLEDLRILGPIHDSFEMFLPKTHNNNGYHLSNDLTIALLAYFNDRWPALKFVMRPLKNDPERLLYFTKKSTTTVLYALTSGEPVDLYSIVEDQIIEELLKTFDNMSVIRLICQHYFATEYSEIKY